ncbi:MAG: CDP-alcohol phosphatidyltransferase family protein [Chloroflexi bacterium]|nr:CDP-alcohol phosphatidyltransferase family protein [Chloroflexota bacterium]
MEQSIDKKEKKERPTFTDFLRGVFRGILTRMGKTLAGWGIHPNVLTTSGLIGTTIGAFFVAQGQFLLGGIIVLFMGLVDGLDGAVARARGEPEDFGAFVDSVSDRYGELVIFAALVWHYLQVGDATAVVLAYFAAAGSVLVSYVRARGQSLNMDTKVGLMTRVERYMVLTPSLVFSIPIVGLWILAIGTNFTALQRILHVRQQYYSRKRDE